MTSKPDELRAHFEAVMSDPALAKAYRRALLDERSHLVRTGWIRSMAVGASDWQGELVPWFNYGVIRLLADRVRRDMTVFEFGAGYSTLWWQRRVSRITAVEHDEGWAAKVAGLVSKPTTIKHVQLDYDGEYCRTILQSEDQYDVIVVDGRDRVNCMKQGLKRLSANGVFVFDNSQRAHYREGIEQVKGGGFKELQLSGIAPMTQAESFTSILYRADNCFGI